MTIEKGAKMKRRLHLLILPITALALAFSYSAPTVFAADEDDDEKPPNDFVMKDTGKDDWVLFSHTKKHQEKVPKCSTCHPKVFSSKQGRTKETKGELKMEAMEKGEFCGKCHNGIESFAVKSPEPTNKDICAKCHSVKKTEK